MGFQYGIINTEKATNASTDLSSCSKEINISSIKEPKNMKEWFYFTFGSGISEKYLIPYNEKVWNIPVDKLSMVWAERIPNPPPEDVLKSSIGIPTEGYLHQLYYNYPKTKMYDLISKTGIFSLRNLMAYRLIGNTITEKILLYC
jgi:protoporphyrinogen oxidase